MRTIGHWLEDVFGPPARWIWHHLLHSSFEHFSKVFGSLWPVVAVAVLVIVGLFIGRYVIRRRQRIDIERVGALEFALPEDPGQLDRLADQAEQQKDWQTAIRLRFRAGVLRLEHLGAIDRGTTKTARQISAVLRSQKFDSLSADLESVVYAGVEATPAQAADARQDWPAVVSEAARNVSSRARAA
jgi:hypothetical protein